MSNTDLFSSSPDTTEYGTTETAAETIVVPLIEEQLVVSKRTLETGTVRLHKRTEERIETIEVPLERVQWHVEHVPFHQVVAEAPAIRQEGETTIYPVVEERVTVLRELVLIEEVRVTRTATTTIEVSEHLLRREQITEERVAASGLTS